MVKGIRLLNKDFINSVNRQPCTAHTLQLPVQEGLKQCKAIHRRVKSLQTFFNFLSRFNVYVSRKANLIKMKILFKALLIFNGYKNKVEFTYLAWKRVLELHNSIRYVSTSLFS